MNTAPTRGFTLIELMIAISIFALLVLLGLPMYGDFIGNTQVRNGAESVLTGIRLAQAEAVRGNLQGKFVLDPTQGTGGWKVWRYNDGDGIAGDPSCPAAGAAQWCLVQSYSWADGAGKTKADPTPADATTILFDGLGRITSTDLVTGATPTTMTEIDVKNDNVSLANRRPLHVVVLNAAGTSAIKLCDPSPAVAANDPRVCPS